MQTACARFGELSSSPVLPVLGAAAAALGQEQRCEPSRVLLTFAAGIPSEKHLERLGGQRLPLSPQGCLYHSEIQTQTNTFQILEKLKPH